MSTAVTANGHALTVASPAVVRSLLDGLAGKRHDAGILGVQAAATWEGPEQFMHNGRSIRVLPCRSTLAVWEALRLRDSSDWLVILTPCDQDDLGAGVMAHFVGNRLRTPDPWEAVRHRFTAERLDPRLYSSGARSREIAAGLLAVLPHDGWTPAPAGVLTRDHALGSVVHNGLRVVDAGVEVDVTAVMAWSARPDATSLLADLRAAAGDALTDEVIDWLAGRCGLAAGPVRTLLAAGKISEIVPLGVLAGLLSAPDVADTRAAGHFQGAFGLGKLTPEVLDAWHADARWLVTHALTDGYGPELASKVLTGASRHVADLGLDELAQVSDMLPAGLQSRLAELARELSSVLPDAATVATAGAGIDEPLVAADLSAAESAFSRIREHVLAEKDASVRAFEAALRLVRWLATDATTPVGSDLALALDQHLTTDSWVDAAVNTAAQGSADSGLADVLGTVLRLVRHRRDRHDVAFAAALAASPEPEQLTVERVLPDVVVPLAQRRPALLLVLDGMSASVANQLVRDAGQLGWVEHAVPGHERRTAALAVLPTLTEFSRCSLLSGMLCHGRDDAERQGFQAVLKGASLKHDVDGGGAPLFHKKDLDTSRPGLTLSPAIHTAVADTEGLPLVAAVLNAVDDALHHTDPAGIDWTLDAVRHLKPLLDAARGAGRIVVLTSDHGHVIERRQGTLRQHSSTYGARARPAVESEPAAGDEVMVSGPRVLTTGNSAILAVDERIRYGPLNAGYHGGGSPAEVVVPVVVLHPGDAPAELGLTSIDGGQPAWWEPTTRPRAHAAGASEPPRGAGSGPRGATRAVSRSDDDAATLFELPGRLPQTTSTPQPRPDGPGEEAAKVAQSVVSSRTFKQQLAIAGRVPVATERITNLLAVLLDAPDRRVPAHNAAATLSVAAPRLRGALHVLKRVLDVEGYVVIRYEEASGDIVLDESLLREQFGVQG
ncbi:BREX-2 system phosphatase PglZ [Phytoactinopolyspora mesophila]|nr:BREX-2 system phosphatase PglZ [Phytoactinopolyspora mesophila]